MNRHYLIEQIRNKKSYLCVGLDTDIKRIPPHLLAEEDPVFAFNKAIIDATKNYCVSYKINTAFYEAMGVKGWETMGKTVRYIPDTHFKIADAKRGDIGNTSEQYARAFFKHFLLIPLLWRHIWAQTAYSLFYNIPVNGRSCSDLPLTKAQQILKCSN